MKLLIKNGRVIDPANKIDSVTDLLVEDGLIAKVAQGISVKADEIIEAKGKIIIPGLVDMHVHLREPGREDKETILSGTTAALHGGITSILAMPNTDPAIDSLENIKILKDAINKSAQANVFICAAITKGRKGEELVDIGALKKAGALAISDDGASIDSDEIMLQAFKQAKKEGILVITHSEDKKLSAGGSVQSGFTATRLGLRGISCESEYKRVERDIFLAQECQAAVHIAHVSCEKSMEIISAAKKKGLCVTCETAPHYFTFNEEAVLKYDTNFKMNPPLRTKKDMLAIQKGLASGLIDVIATDHAPHTENEKEIEFERSEFGVIGLETELAVCISELLNNNLLDWSALVTKLALNPSRILGINKGTLSVGADADIAIIDPAREWVVKKDFFLSKSRNSSFIGRTLKGCVDFTICRGKIFPWSL